MVAGLSGDTRAGRCSGARGGRRRRIPQALRLLSLSAVSLSLLLPFLFLAFAALAFLPVESRPVFVVFDVPAGVEFKPFLLTFPRPPGAVVAPGFIGSAGIAVFHASLLRQTHETSFKLLIS
jgi:hypothetical protein